MSTPFETTCKDIEHLEPQDVTELLERLLYLEAEKLALPKRRISVSLNISVSDGGEDGRVEWEGGPSPEESKWFPRRLTLFQVKAKSSSRPKMRVRRERRRFVES
jgi:hypothetical protein